MVDSKGFKWKGDRWEIEPLQPSSDIATLLKTFKACIEGASNPLLRFASGLFRGIGPVLAEATTSRPSHAPKEKTAPRDPQVVAAIEKVSIKFMTDADLRSRVATPESQAMIRMVSDNLRNELLRASDEDPDTALLLKEVSEKINGIKVALPEFAPQLVAELGLPKGAYLPEMNAVFVGHNFRGMHEVGNIIHEFSHVREHFNAEIVKTTEYDPQKIADCINNIKEIPNVALLCLAEGDQDGKACTAAASFEPAFRARMSSFACRNLHKPADERLLKVEFTAPDPHGQAEATKLIYRQVGEGRECLHVPLSLSRKGASLRPFHAWEASIAELYLKTGFLRSREQIEAIYRPDRVAVEYHAFFVESVPRSVAKEHCPDLFRQSLVKSKARRMEVEKPEL